MSKIILRAKERGYTIKEKEGLHVRSKIKNIYASKEGLAFTFLFVDNDLKNISYYKNWDKLINAGKCIEYGVDKSRVLELLK